MTLSLSRLTVGLCVTLILVTATISLVVTYKFSLDAAKGIAFQHSLALAQKARDDVEDFLNKPIGFITGLQYSLKQNFNPLPNITELSNDDWYIWWWQRFVASMKAADFKYQYAVAGFDDGNYAGCKMVSLGFMCRVFKWSTRAATGKSATHDRTYNVSDGSIIATGNGQTSYDPRTRGWYKMVEHKEMAMEWSSVYLSAMPTLPIVDVNAALFNGTGALLGIASLTFELGALTDVLTGLVTTPNTKAVLLDNDNLMLASTFETPYLSETNVSKSYSGPVASNCVLSDNANDATRSIILCRHSVESYDNPELQQLATQHAELVQNGDKAAHRIRLRKENYYVSVQPITTDLSKGMRWRFVLLMPESDVIAPIIQGRNIALIIVSVVILLSAVLTGFAVDRMLHPIDHLADRMYRTACLDDTDALEEHSLFTEIDTIQTAYETMNAELKKVKSYLPQSVLAALYGDAADDDEGELESVGDASDTKSKQSTVEKQSNSKQSTQKKSESHPSSVRSSKKNGSTTMVNVAPAALNTALKLVNRKVTVLTINLCGFHHVVKSVLPDELLVLQAEIVSAVTAIIRQNKGVLDTFHGDHFIASFNAVTNVASHACAASHAALQVIAKLSNKDKFRISKVTCGIATGQATVGNMGSSEMKRFCVVGPVFSHAMIFEQMCKLYPDTSCVIGGFAITEAEQFFDFQYLDVVSLPYFNPPVDNKRSRIASLKGAHETSCDEWMYQLEEGAGRSQFTLHNEAFEKFVTGDTAHANELWRRYLEKNPTDRIASTLATLMDTVDTRSYCNPLHDFFTSCVSKTPSEIHEQPLRSG